jgi:hypothetical protein
MGVSQLPPIIKKTKGVLASGLKEKRAHVDLLSLCFGTMRGMCYNSLATTIRKAAVDEAVVPNTPNIKKRPAIEELGPQSSLKRIKNVKASTVKKTPAVTSTTSMSVTQFLSNIKPSKERLPKNESRVSMQGCWSDDS